MVFQFNTGRHYSAEGQPISCHYRWSQKMLAHVIVFNDTARGISGWFPYNGRTDDVRFLQEVVMSAYDHYAYGDSVHMV